MRFYTNQQLTSLTVELGDASVLRLDADTTVELSTSSNSAGESIAAIILADGQLWGRVLTSSGMDFGAGGYIAGVRGTSILVSKNSSQVTIAIIDSTNNGNTPDTAAAFVKNTNPWADQTPIYVDAGSKIVEQSGATVAPTEETGITKASLLADIPWAKKNTLEDIDYLSKIKDASSTLPVTRERAWNEIAQVLPKTNDPTESTALCGARKVFWEKLVGKKKKINDDKYEDIDKCRETGLIAFADFTNKWDGTLYVKDGTPITPTKSGNRNTWETEDEGAKIEGNSYIQYDYTNLAGKTVEIEFKELPTGQGNIVGGIDLWNVILDGSDSLRITRKKTNQGTKWLCSWISSSTLIDCEQPNNTSSFYIETFWANTIKIHININLIRFVLWNSIRNEKYLQQPLNTLIRAVKIYN